MYRVEAIVETKPFEELYKKSQAMLQAIFGTKRSAKIEAHVIGVYQKKAIGSQSELSRYLEKAA